MFGVDRHVAEAHDHLARVERLAGQVGRAGVGAPPALGAGEPVEEVLPAEVLERPQAERGVLRLEVHRRQLPSRGELAEVDIEEGRRDVEMLAPGQVAHEGGHDHDVAPPQDGEGVEQELRRQAAEGHGQGIGHERPGHGAVVGRLEGLGEELGQDHPADQEQDDQGPPGIRQPARPGDQAPDEGVAHGRQDDQGNQVLHRRDERPQDAPERDREDCLDQPAGHDVGRPDRQQDEAPEDPEMHDPGPAVLEHLRLEEGVADDPADPQGNAGERVRAGRPDRGEDPQVAGDDQERSRRPSPRTGGRPAGRRGHGRRRR